MVVTKGLFNILFQNQRASIGGFEIDATLRELHESNCEITDDPIEDGADASDHVQLKPKTVTLEGVVTDTPISTIGITNVQGIMSSVNSILGKSSRSMDGYDILLALQSKKQPFDLVTGLKTYKNMLIEELSVQRTKDTGRAIDFTAKLKEIIIVKTREVPLRPIASAGTIASETKDAGKVSAGAASTQVAGKTSVLRGILDKIKKAF